MTLDTTQPPAPPSTGWQTPGPTRRPRIYLGLPAWVWVVAWVPLLPVTLLAIAAPGFVEPMVDSRVRVVGLPPLALFLVLPLINLAVARLTRNEGATLLTVGLTSFLGLVLAILGPAFILILVNLSM